jgi:hypothetical protein
LAFFTAYLDDSGTAPDQRIAVASCIVIPANQIFTLEEHWERFLDKYKFNNFHASACANAPKTKDRQYRDFDEAKKELVFTRTREFCKKFGVQVFSFAVFKDTYDSVIPQEYREYAGSHYTWAVRHIQVRVQQRRNHRGIKEPIQEIFDWQDVGSDCRNEIDDVIGQQSEQLNEIIHHDFQYRKEVSGLQLVDLIAWTALQLAHFEFFKKPVNKYANETLRDLELYPKRNEELNPFDRWFQVSTLKKKQLEAWIQNEKQTKSLEHFRNWYERHPPRKLLLDARRTRIQTVEKATSKTVAVPDREIQHLEEEKKTEKAETSSSSRVVGA